MQQVFRDYTRIPKHLTSPSVHLDVNVFQKKEWTLILASQRHSGAVKAAALSH